MKTKEKHGALIDELISLLLLSRGNSSCKNSDNCYHCTQKIAAKIANAVNLNETLTFILPAFPAKSANRHKTLSALPDYGERLALRRLNELLQAIKTIYPPGAHLVICSDGRVFSDVVGVKEEDVDIYRSAMSDLVCDEKIHDISFFDLESIWPSHTFDKMREALMQSYGRDLDTIKNNIKKNENEKKLFNGLHRFLYEDVSYLYSDLSKNQIRLLSKDKTYQTIQRSHAWSECIKDHFPYAIRLSIHPQTCQSEKLSFQLLKADNRWATPWHNVVLKKKDSLFLVNNKEAKLMGAQLVVNNGRASHYEWN